MFNSKVKAQPSYNGDNLGSESNGDKRDGGKRVLGGKRDYGSHNHRHCFPRGRLQILTYFWMNYTFCRYVDHYVNFMGGGGDGGGEGVNWYYTDLILFTNPHL